MAGEGLQKGWVSLYRSIQDHWLWQEKPFSKGQAWMDLLLSANHKEAKVLLGNELVQVEKGCLITSQAKLMERWDWGNTKVRNFLKLLKEDGMIDYSGKAYTLIRIKNYETYQNQTTSNADISKDNANTQTADKPTTNCKQTDDKLRANTNNNDNNDNNDNKYIYTSDSNEYRLAEYLYKHILKNNPKAKEPNFQTWSKQFDYILRIDERPIEEVKELIKFSQQHDFWYKNILSPEKLRKQYDKLILERKDPKPKDNKPKGNFNDYEQRKYDFDTLEKELLELNDTGEEVNGQALLDEIRNNK